MIIPNTWKKMFQTTNQQTLAKTLEAFAPLDSERSAGSGRRAPQSSLAVHVMARQLQMGMEQH